MSYINQQYMLVDIFLKKNIDEFMICAIIISQYKTKFHGVKLLWKMNAIT